MATKPMTGNDYYNNQDDNDEYYPDNADNNTDPRTDDDGKNDRYHDENSKGHSDYSNDNASLFTDTSDGGYSNSNGYQTDYKLHHYKKRTNVHKDLTFYDVTAVLPNLEPPPRFTLFLHNQQNSQAKG